MNLAEIYIRTPEGYAMREELSPGPSAFAAVLDRGPFIKGPLTCARRPCSRSWGAPFNVSDPENMELAARIVTVLARTPERLTFSAMFHRLDLPQNSRFYLRSRRILQWLCGDGRVKSEGKHRVAVYWVNHE